VSPGVYTSELDLTFVAQSVGVTTLGLAGETLKGPAFEPILISNFDDFKLYFGTTSPEKYGDGNPKYELGYVAKSYLQESNQLFVTRVLGLTGYKPKHTFGIKTIGGIILQNDPPALGYEISAITISNSSITTTDAEPGSTTNLSRVLAHLTGVTSFTEQIADIVSYLKTTYGGYTGLTTGSTNEYFWIGKNTEGTVLSGITGNGTELVSPLTGKKYENNNNTKEWWNTMHYDGSGLVTPPDGDSVTGVYSYLFQFDNASNKWSVTQIEWDARLAEDYHNIVIAALRPRGVYSGQTLIHEVAGDTSFTLSSVTGQTLSTNPLGEFNINVTGVTEGQKQFTCTLDKTSTKYISKVLGTEVFDKDNGDYPVYVHEVYPNYLKAAYDRGLVRGIQLDVSYELEGDNFLGQWDTTISPMVVSEVRGGKVADLFQVITISDGEAANYQVKINIQNINLETMEFDLVVRDFNDTDDNQIALEKYSRCSMNPDMPGYVARKVGTSDGEYPLVSRRIMLTMALDAPVDAVPSGFKGFANNESFGVDDTLGNIIYKTKYNDAGDIETYDVTGTPNIESGDKVRKVMLGLSSSVGFDIDLLKYKGASGTTETTGFHLSKNAATITGATNVTTNSLGQTLDDVFGVGGYSPTTGFAYYTTPYDLEGQTDEETNKLTNINFRKFTFAVYGGRDGWDIYRRTRTNTDAYIFGKTVYKSGHKDDGGVFNGPFQGEPNSDYYAYLQGIETYSNPEAVDINVFATPGINFQDHSSLVNQAIEMIEEQRADSLYVMNSPNILGANATEQIVSALDTASIDSNYSATYWPWIQVRDTDNATNLYIPPTGEVVKNIALTDNVSFPWFAVAGYSRGLVNAVKATKKLTLDDRDVLYKNRINPIATFSDTGTIIWGNKTLQVRESALDRINVRRLLLRARKLISAVSVRLLFEQNDDQVRNEFLRLVNPILDAIKKERGLFDFRVTVSNDPEDIDANTMRGKIYIKPTRSLEFIDVEFIITPTGASFENI
jgi:hypothetical protein